MTKFGCSALFELDKFVDVESTDYDIFIHNSSEKRAKQSLEILKKSKSTFKKSIMVNFTENTKSKFKKVGNKVIVDCSYHNSESGINCIIDACETLKKITSPDKILIDITSFPPPHLFFLLKRIAMDRKIKKFDVIYTAPKIYKKIDGRYLFSQGTRSVEAISSYTGREDATLTKQLLIVLLGFEGNRSSEILRDLQPDKTIAINGFPSYSLEYKDTSILENQVILLDPSCLNKKKMASAYDPFRIAKVLEEIYRKSKRYNISIAPLGTKPMSLGACLSCLNNKRITVVFPKPTTYSTESPVEVGKTWIYKIEDLQ